VTPIPVNTPAIEAGDRAAVSACLEAGWVSSEGPDVARFERNFAALCGRAHGVAVSSGTAALDIAVRALGLGPGDEVLVPSLTIISCAQAIVAAGATPVPVDCDADDWNAHLAHFEARRGPRTRAIMLVHLYGLCADLDPILQWAESHGLIVIEDASQAHGLQYRGRRCGGFGRVSVFSFYANKLITTGEGGMLVCDDASLAARCASLRNLCFVAERRFWHEELGWNYRMTAMQAALGAAQLPRIEVLLQKKRALGRRYREAFVDVRAFSMAPEALPWVDNAYWVFALVLTPDAVFERDALLAALSARGIGTRTFFHGLHEQPALLRDRHVEPVSLPTTERLSQRGFYLPSGLGLGDEDQQRVIDAVLDFTGSAA
jgi:perosamine synthetase